MEVAILNFISTLVWPAVVVGFGIILIDPIKELLIRLKSIKLNMLGNEVELTVQEVENTLNELVSDIKSLVNGITKEERQLYIDIKTSRGKETVRKLLPDFKRGNKYHKMLQNLREMKLIKPLEGDSWQENKHPVVTKFSGIIERLEPKLR